MIRIPIQIIAWSTTIKTEYSGETVAAFWQTINFDGLRVQKFEYSAGYLAVHWCQKGHIVQCLEGSFESELENGKIFWLCAAQAYVVSDNMSSHRSISKNGVKLLIIDGGFLK